MSESKTGEFSVGDIFYTQAGNQYHLFKLLASEAAFNCYHILSYSPLRNLPAEQDFNNLPVAIYHSPFDKTAFAASILLTSKPVTSADLIGYHEYLRQTRDPNDYVPIVISYYQSGLRLTDDKKYQDAIDSYSKAVDLMPQFFEAIDNRAFCKMDLGWWTDAIEDFKLSLQQNPNSVLAEFSIGECYYKMGNYPAAKKQFEIALKIDPNDALSKQFLDKLNTT